MIDAVVTWVNGADPQHQNKRAKYLDQTVSPSSYEPTRFDSLGEIRFAVLSLLQFCPFLRNIHIVTDAQHPVILDPILAAYSNVKVVDHVDIFGEHADLLPVFSSRSIETMIHRIPGLAEQFLYLNDDIFVGRPMTPQDYFYDGTPIIRGSFRSFPNPALQWLKSKVRKDRPGYNAAQRDAARLAGLKDKYLISEHQPHPMRRSTLQTHYKDKVLELREQISYRFRSSRQVSPIGLSNHLEMARGARVEGPFDVGYIRPGRPTGTELQNVLSHLNENHFASFCVQSLDQMPAKDAEAIINALNRRYYIRDA
ncbi:Stealth protein CR1, conserved region 1 [Sulfitobacter litoralis]|uniref:Stealth protein CR1, conserved region 1 n=1 Tax=Sulfitobacter litoralis TaxID=335975 RepID=A0ABY0SV68_9RHOB|nr:stealth family protein [Sulfitobacter litoralis]SDP63860.1 Stealth protein CR1, conserved region 1 [Sulfitobacter litoralis]